VTKEMRILKEMRIKIRPPKGGSGFQAPFRGLGVAKGEWKIFSGISRCE